MLSCIIKRHYDVTTIQTLLTYVDLDVLDQIKIGCGFIWRLIYMKDSI